MAADTLQGLIARIREGDAQAETEFQERFKPEIRREMARKLRSSQLKRAVDPSELWNLAFKSFLSYVKGCGPEKAAAIGKSDQLWKTLRTFANRKFIDELRRWLPRLSDERPTEHGDDSAHIHADACEQFEIEDLVPQGLSQLPPGDRDVIQLRSFENLSFQQIAACLGSAPDAVRMRYHRAIKKLGAAIACELKETPEK